MAKNKSGQTAFGAATARLIEQHQPEGLRLFYDPMLTHILNRGLTFLLRFKVIRSLMVRILDDKTEGIYGGLVCRSKYIDEQMEEALDKGIEQILILGAGMDTRPYRIETKDQIRIFEVDLVSEQQFKKERIEQYLVTLPDHVTYVPIDFNTDSLDQVLRQSQFDLSKPTFVVLEGVTQYISEEATNKIFGFISTMAPGSYVIFTYILNSVIDKRSGIKGANELIDFFSKRNSPWMFGMEQDEIGLFLKKYGLSLTEDVGANHYQERYLKPINRSLRITEIERVALARRSL